MIGSRKWLATTAIALSGVMCVSPLLAQNQNQNRTGGTTSNNAPSRPGVFRSFFQNAFGRNTAESEAENEPEAPAASAMQNKPRTMPKASNTTNNNNNTFSPKTPAKVPTRTITNPLVNNNDSGQRSLFTRPQASNNSPSLLSIANKVCLCHPDARREMIAALNDRSDATRLAAVQALVASAQHQCPNCGRSPCDDDVVAQILADIAFGKDASGRWLEPSENVRYTAREALRYAHRQFDTQEPQTSDSLPGQSLMPQTTRPQAGSFVSDDDLATPRDDRRVSTPMQGQTKPAPIQNKGTFSPQTKNNRTPSNTSAPPVVINDDPVDPPRPMPTTQRNGGVGFAVPGRGNAATSPARITNDTINDDPPAAIPEPRETSSRSSAPSRLTSPELDTSSPSTESTPKQPRGGTVIIEDSPPTMPETLPTKKPTVTPPASDDLPAVTEDSDTSASGRVSSRRAKRATPPAVTVPALSTPSVETPSIPAFKPSTIPAPVGQGQIGTPAPKVTSPNSATETPAPALPKSEPTAPVLSSPMPALTAPQATSEPTPSAEPVLSPSPAPALAPSPVSSPSPTPAPNAEPSLAPSPSAEPTPAPVPRSMPGAAPIRSVGPNSSSATPSLAPQASPTTSGKSGEPSLAPAPTTAPGPQLGPAARKTIISTGPGVIRSSFEMGPARGSRISAFDENPSPVGQGGSSTIKIK
jgi:hypothetical protein